MAAARPVDIQAMSLREILNWLIHPKPRNRPGELGWLHPAIGAVLTLVVGPLVLVDDDLLGLIVIAFGIYMARLAYTRYISRVEP
jgi:hypothetical protein